VFVYGQGEVHQSSICMITNPRNNLSHPTLTSIGFFQSSRTQALDMYALQGWCLWSDRDILTMSLPGICRVWFWIGYKCLSTAGRLSIRKWRPSPRYTRFQTTCTSTKAMTYFRNRKSLSCPIYARHNVTPAASMVRATVRRSG
jgi:hypothetical protein